MNRTTIKNYMKESLLCILALLAFISMQYRVNNVPLNVSLIITFFVLITIGWFNLKCFTVNDFIVVLINVASILVTLYFFPGSGVAVNFMNLLLCLIIFNKVEFSEIITIITRIIIISGILVFLITSTYSIEWGWISFYDKNGILVNNNTVAFILVALYIHLSTLLLKKHTKKQIVIFLCLLIFSIVSVYELGCRTAMLFFILYGILMIFRKKITGRNKITRKLCITFLIISFFFPIIYIFLYNLIGNFEIMKKNLFSGREIVWLEAYKQIKISPLFGSGTKFVINYGNNITTSTHNMLLGLWKNLGIIPMISLVYFYMLNKRPKIETNILISIIAITIIACFESFLMDSRLYLLFLLAFPGTKNEKQIDEKINL